MALSNTLLNLSIRWKLMLGFGLLLILVLVISTLSVTSISTLMNEADSVESVGSIEAHLADARFAEKNFLMRNDQQYVEAANDAISKALAAAEGEFQKAHSPSRRQELASVIDNITQYRSNFTETVSQVADRQNAQASMESAARTAVSELQMFEQLLRQRADERIAQTNDEAAIRAARQAAAASGLAADILEIRTNEKNYLLDLSADHIDELFERLERVDSSLTALTSELPPGERRQQIEAVAEALASYRADVGRLVANTEDMSANEREMVENARLTEDAATRVYEEQQAVMSNLEESVFSQLMIATAVSFVLGIMATLLITRVIVRPLNDVVEVAEQVAKGDLTATMKADRKDEIGKVMAAMQAMTVNLRGIVKELADGIAQIASASEELSAVTEQTSAGAAQQRDETDQAATAMQEMTATVQDVARNAESAAESATMADRHAREGFEVVRGTVQQIETLSDDVESSANAIARLRSDSANIGTVLDVIKSIAEQTNLLALNAAIEAARAGEQGRGFAVVADEVRSLAQRTQDSTVEIETLVQALQNGAEDAVTSMNRNSQTAESTVTAARAAGEALKTIADAVSNIQAMNLQIATAVEQQTSVAENISEGMVTIREVTDQSATATNQISASSNELAKLGGDLQRLVDRFVVA